MKADVLNEVKKEVEKMLEAGFIRACRYAEWISTEEGWPVAGLRGFQRSQ
jgi:hypothetical protein